ncbi:MAG TPA: HAMP domain-containing protein [Eubacteriaceae bacterium]|jgi:two-component system sensor histidine kinase ArlS|nr:HAMP domain-containing protein [Eubacteriaceae bacterium]
MNKENENSTKFTTKLRSSLVLKLNFQMMGRLISVFFAMNMIIIVMMFFVFIWKAEEGGKSFLQSQNTPPFTEQSMFDDQGYEILAKDYPGKGIKLSNALQKKLPLNTKDARRSIAFSKNNKGKGILEKIYSIRYIMEVPFNNSYYEIIYLLGRDIRIFSPLFFIILIIELSIIIINTKRGYKNIRKTLEPINELTKTAQSFNRGVPQDVLLKDLAGAISNIDANKLDNYISIDSSQDELKDLASAINSMLNRINHSYQSQVRFVSDASHELRTPISVIQGYANLLDRWGKTDEITLQESIDAIKSEADNMKDLVEQLLFLARGDNETIQLHKETFDCTILIEEVIRETKMINDNHNFEVTLDSPAFISGDKQLLKQAIRILVDNSIKFTPTGETIFLKVKRKDNSIHIIVQDSGIGISPKDLPHIFDRFYRSDESRARKTGGSGLGLSIAKWIIEEHDGYFKIISRMDIGTRITMVFDQVTNTIEQ